MQFADAEQRIKAAIKAATSESLFEPDWGANMNIVDYLNQQPALCPVAASVLRKRIQDRNVDISLLALTLVQGLMKNCPSFHSQANRPEFLDALVGEVERARNPKKGFLQRLGSSSNSEEDYRKGLEKTEKLLIALEEWGKAFANSKSFPNFRQTYERLKRSGVRFPVPTKDEVSPIFTPAGHPPPPSSNPSQEFNKAKPGSPLFAHSENARIFVEMLHASDEYQDLSKNDLVQELLRAVRSAHHDVIRRISDGPGEVLMAQLLELNDKIIGAIDLYDGLLAGTRQREVLEPAASDDDEDEEEDEEQKQVDVFDLLNLNDSEPPKSEKNGKKSKGKQAAKRNDSDVVVPKLEPPPSSKSLARKASGGSQPNSNVDDSFDLLGFVGNSAPSSGNNAQSPTNGSDPFDLFSASPKGVEHVSSVTPVASDDEEAGDDADFFALAMRGVPAQQQQQQNPAPPSATTAPKNSNPFDSLF